MQVDWPIVFTKTRDAIAILNLNFANLPDAACVFPNPKVRALAYTFGPPASATCCSGAVPSDRTRCSSSPTLPRVTVL